LNRPKFTFSRARIGGLINKIRDDGVSVLASPCDILFTDNDDKMFYEVALECGAFLVTGNLRHFPNAPFILSAAQFLSRI
jgi:hypothetical protein